MHTHTHSHTHAHTHVCVRVSVVVCMCLCMCLCAWLAVSVRVCAPTQDKTCTCRVSDCLQMAEHWLLMVVRGSEPGYRRLWPESSTLCAVGITHLYILRLTDRLHNTGQNLDGSVPSCLMTKSRQEKNPLSYWDTYWERCFIHITLSMK